MDTRVKPAYDQRGRRLRPISHKRVAHCNPVMTPLRLTSHCRTGTVAAISRRSNESPLMFSIASLWIPFTITAALGQVARNAMQRR